MSRGRNQIRIFDDEVYLVDYPASIIWGRGQTDSWAVAAINIIWFGSSQTQSQTHSTVQHGNDARETYSTNYDHILKEGPPPNEKTDKGNKRKRKVQVRNSTQPDLPG